ncbi:MAG: WD40/YVTN/BNR-like repeat-containing protein [Actinomycetota bacterium]
MDSRTTRTLVTTVALGLVLAACSPGGSSGGDQGQIGTRATISHIHGLGVDSTGTPYVATHFGLIKAGASGGWVYASADKNDHMGFSLHAADGIFYRSGHSPSRPSLGVESSTDAARWTHLSDVASPPVDFHAMAVSFVDSKTLWGWDSGGRGTFRSTDGGKTWTRLEASGIERQIFVLAGPAEPNVVLAGTMSGLYRSTDGGTAWQQIQGVSGGWVIAVAADPKDPNHMIAFTERGMKSSDDGGKTWAPALGGIPPGSQITSLAISPTDGKTAYAADASKIYKTTDGGKTWTAVPASS